MIETVQSHSHVICCLVKTTTAPYHMACMACVCVSPKGRGRNLVLEFGKIAPQKYHMACMACISYGLGCLESPKGRVRNLVLEFGKIAPQKNGPL